MTDSLAFKGEVSYETLAHLIDACALSSDGLNWAGSASLPVGAVISSLVWGGPGYGRWIAVGYNGMILASP